MMRDHPNHRSKIMGGMWGCRNRILIPHSKQYLKYCHNGIYGDDQTFLQKLVYSHIRDNSILHIGNSAPVFPGDPDAKPFMSKIINQRKDFVGSVIEDDGFPFWTKAQQTKKIHRVDVI
jgi:hypothetical protein